MPYIIFVFFALPYDEDLDRKDPTKANKQASIQTNCSRSAKKKGTKEKAGPNSLTKKTKASPQGQKQRR